ncbi:MAG: Na+/H+ antiporter subunit D [Bacteroidetes bacterium]|nr:MAG: Na+/H+ antiporter subunit D [Bacteroidota bacterium]
MTIVALPILIPFVLAISLLVFRTPKTCRWVGAFGSFAIFVVSVMLFTQLKTDGILILNVGGWDAPFGIVLVVDYLSALMLMVSSLILIAVSLFAIRFLPDDIPLPRFYFFFFTLTMGMNGAFITGDAFNLYVWFEVMLISSFVLITMGKRKEQLEGGIKYLALNLLGSLLFLAGLGLLYGKTGTLNMAHLAEILKNDDQALLMNTSAILFFVAFGIKAAVFPLFFWLPSSYHTPNITITSLFAGLLTKVGVYTLIRFFTLFFVHDQQFWHNLLLIVAGLTMVTGGMAAASYYETRRILSYHIISQIGYMIMGLGIFTPLAIAGAVFFTLHNMIAKTGAFLASGMIAKIKGTYHLKEVGGLYKQNPLLAVLFIVPAFALAGIPPLSGFFAKFMLIKAGIESGSYIITTVALLTGLLTLYSMIKIWNEAFLKKQPENFDNKETVKLYWADYVPLAILATASVLMGIFAATVFTYAMEAANQLIEPANYIDTVLRNRTP